jgi:hypothetical protein
MIAWARRGGAYRPPSATRMPLVVSFMAPLQVDDGVAVASDDPPAS